MEMIRLNKYLSECGIASRRKSDELILEGRVQVNKKVVIELGIKIDPSKDVVTVDGEKIKAKGKVYFILNKPRGVVSTTDDEKNRTNVVDLVKTREAIFPVGRLDYHTTGLLILTNDGEFAYKLTHPKHHIEREYVVTLNRELEPAIADKLLKGITLEGRKAKFTELEFISKKNTKKVKVITVEGRNHFVKRMFGAFGYFVNDLDRTRFGAFTYEKLERGAYMQVDEDYIKFKLKESKFDN